MRNLQRDDEFYPQAGDGYIWEPALQVVHADGNTSTALVFDDITQTNDSAGHGIDPNSSCTIRLIRLKSRCVSAPTASGMFIEQWTEIINHESGAVTLKRMASTALLLPLTNVYLTHFFGDWAKEMLSPITEQITPGTKVLDSKLGVRADQFHNPSFILSLNGQADRNQRRRAGGFARMVRQFSMRLR